MSDSANCNLWNEVSVQAVSRSFRLLLESLNNKPTDTTARQITAVAIKTSIDILAYDPGEFWFGFEMQDELSQRTE